MASLDRMPPEISHQILQHFLPDYSDRDDGTPVFSSSQPRQNPNEPSWYSLNQDVLFNLSLTCRQLRSLAELYLYEEFAPGFGDSWKSKSRFFSWTKRFAGYAKTIVARPDLAARVRRLYLHHKVLDAMTVAELREVVPVVVEELEDRAPFGDWQPPLLIEAQHNTGLKWTLKDRVQLRLDLAKMLTFLMPNLEHLCILASDKRQWLPIVIRAESMPPLEGLNVSQFQNLRRFDMALGEDAKLDFVSMVEALLPLLKMFQHLETLNLHMVCNLGLSYRVNTTLHHLKTLRVTRTNLYTNEVDQLLAHCPNVETLIYEAGPPMIIDELEFPPGGDHFHPADFASVVASKNPRELKEIRLDLRRGGGYYMHNDDRLPVVGFRTLPKLKTLFMDLGTWRKISRGMDPPGRLPEMLPPGLETLELAETFWGPEDFVDISAQLHRLADFVDMGKFPELRRIRFDAVERAPLSDLEARLARHGISLEAGEYPLTGSKGVCARVPFSWDEFLPTHILPLPGDSDDDL